jgi:hypothetical protein
MHPEPDPTTTQPPAAPHVALPSEWLTDVIDELSRDAFRRALDRRHPAVAYRRVIESAHLVPTRP